MRISDCGSDGCSSDLTEFIGYSSTEGEGEVVAIVKDGVNFDSAAAGETVLIVTNQTPFYGESGGPMGDAGTISSQSGLVADVEDTAKPLGRLHAHRAKNGAGRDRKSTRLNSSH